MSDKITPPWTRPRRALAGDDHAGWRLDRFLAAALPDFSRSRLQQLLEEGAVSLGARTIKDANHRVKPGENYVVDRAADRAGHAARPGYSAGCRLRRQGPDRHQQAGGPGGASRRRQSRRHPGQCPDRPLRQRSTWPSAARRGPASCTGWTRTHPAFWSRPRPSAPWPAWPSNSPITPSSAPITPWCGAARASPAA